MAKNELEEVKKEKVKKEKKPLSPSKKKKRRRIIIWLSVIGVIVLYLVISTIIGNAKIMDDLNSVAKSEYTQMMYGDIFNTISASGTVESADSRPVYSTQTYNVESVLVKAGDIVKTGDILCELDASTLEDQVETQEASFRTTSATAQAQIKAARDSYNDAKAAIDNGLNSTLISAQSSLNNAYDAFVKAQNTYQRYEDGLELKENSTLITQGQALRQAKETLESAKDALADAERGLTESKDDLATGLSEINDDKLNMDNNIDNAEDRLDDAEKKLRAANTAYNNAVSAAASAQRDVDRKNAALDNLLEQDPAPAEAIAEARQALKDAQALLVSAQTTLNSATSAKASAEAAVSSFETSLDSVYDSSSALDTTQTSKKNSLNRAVTNAENKYERCKRALENASAGYDDAMASYSAAAKAVDQTLADYADAAASAKKSYELAQSAYSAAQATVQTQLSTALNSLNTTLASTDTTSSQINLRQLKEKLEDTKIKAPCDGTVTAVFATVGKSGSGVLFVIENTDALIIKTNVKGYDIGTVKEGMKVRIESDATGDREIEGVITNIAPASNKNSMGETDAGDALFATEIEVTTKDSGLYIGISARLDIIVEEAHDVYKVAYDSVGEDEDGAKYILIAVPNEKYDMVTIEKYPVTTGVEDDMNVEISSDKITKELLVLNDPSDYINRVGMTMKLVDKKLLTGDMSEYYAAMMGE